MQRLLLILTLLATIVAEASPSRILFVGNSYTSVNNLPAIFKEVVASAGQPPPTIEAATPGGKTLEQHSRLPETLAKIDKGNWDVVIVQGQSQEAAMSEVADNMRTSFLGGAEALFARIRAKSPNAKIVLYETWARHADYWKNPQANTYVGHNATEMQARIRKWYAKIAEGQKNVVVAPVGDAWELNYKNPAAVRLHSKDNSHPAFNGSYLAALVFHAMIYQPATLKVRHTGNIRGKEAAYLQKLAAQAVKGMKCGDPVPEAITRKP